MFVRDQGPKRGRYQSATASEPVTRAWWEKALRKQRKTTAEWPRLPDQPLSLTLHTPTRRRPPRTPEVLRAVPRIRLS